MLYYLNPVSPNELRSPETLGDCYREVYTSFDEAAAARVDAFLDDDVEIIGVETESDLPDDVRR